MAINSINYQTSYKILDPEWKKHNHRAMQCEMEAKYYVTPDQISDFGKALAQKGTCNKETDEWGSGITK